VFVLQCHGAVLKHGLGYGVIHAVRHSILDAIVDHDHGMIAPVLHVVPYGSCRHDASYLFP